MSSETNLTEYTQSQLGKPGHRTRFSDSSIRDEVCVLCGADDSYGNMERLKAGCPSTERQRIEYDLNQLPKGQRLSLQQIQKEVGVWSRANFGAQVSKTTGAELGSLAPLLGLFEEYGELIQADEARDIEEQKDALGDIGIYLCDFASRDQAALPVITWDENKVTVTKRLVVTLGKLSHVVLKRHQGIRGYDNDHKYIQERDEQLRLLLDALEARCQCYFKQSFDQVVEATWMKVKQRNWAKNKVDAHARPCG